MVYVKVFFYILKKKTAILTILIVSRLLILLIDIDVFMLLRDVWQRCVAKRRILVCPFLRIQDKK